MIARERKLKMRSDIPMPKNVERVIEKKKSFLGMKNKPLKYNVSQLEIGDSFVYDKNMYMYNGHKWYFELTTGYKFKAKETNEGVRVWRIE